MLLRFTSTPCLFAIPAGSARHSCMIGSWRVTEDYKDADPADHLSPEVMKYWLVLERDVPSLQDLAEQRILGHQLIAEIERIWPYICAIPLHPRLSTLVPLAEASGWRSNYAEQVQAHQEIIAQFQFKPRQWTYLPWLPLASVAKAREGYLGLDDVFLALIDLHYGSLTMDGISGRDFCLVRALEIARHLLPGRSDLDKERSLHADARTAMHNNLAWLFRISNQRFDLRHPVDTAPASLKPRLSSDERQKFYHDADLVIRSLVCHKLNLDFHVVARR